MALAAKPPPLRGTNTGVQPILHSLSNQASQRRTPTSEGLAARRAFDTTHLRTMPNHYDAAAKSVNQGVPITRLAPDSQLSQALMAMARGGRA